MNGAVLEVLRAYSYVRFKRRNAQDLLASSHTGAERRGLYCSATLYIETAIRTCPYFIAGQPTITVDSLQQQCGNDDKLASDQSHRYLQQS